MSEDVPVAAGADLPQRAEQMFVDLLADTHLSKPSDLTAILAARARAVGVEEMVVYLIDYELMHLVPVPGPGASSRGVLRVEGTVGGRAFALLSAQDVDAGRPHRRRLWLPLLDGTARLGVVELVLVVPDSDGAVEPRVVVVCERYAHLAAQLVMGKGQYGDAFELVRRRRPMALAAELQWDLIPPLTFATPGLVLSAMLEPAYDVGGDSFDYAVNESVAHVAVFDAMGHGLPAAVAASIVVAGYRNGRRRLLDLAGTYATCDEALAEQFGGERFATAVLAQLDLATGVLSWVNAGHPPPLLLRNGQIVKMLTAPPSTPLGIRIEKSPPQVGYESLEPGDQVLFYTDGLVEARTSDGQFFSTQRLAEFLERQAAAGLPAPETLRRLRHAILRYQRGRLQDDATAVLVQWRSDAELALLPDTA